MTMAPLPQSLPETPPPVHHGPEAISPLATAEQEILAQQQAEGDDETTLAIGQAMSEVAENATPNDQIPASSELLQTVQARIGVVARLQALDRQRRDLLSAGELDEETKAELRRQDRELRQMPSAQEARTALEVQERQNKSEQVQLDVGVAPSLAAEPPAEQRLQVEEMARQQWQLLIERDQLTPRILDLAATEARDEPLLRILRRSPRPPEALFGWAVYGLTLLATKARAAGQRGREQEQLDRCRKKSDEAARWRQSIELLDSIVAATERELAAIEAAMVQEFWAAYEEAAVLLAGGEVAPEEAVVLRALLRFGLIGVGPRFLPAGLAERLLAQCAESALAWDRSCQATHVLYADEYLLLVARGIITPSVDEDLELNHRGKPEWKLDRAWRRLVYGRARLATLEQTLVSLEKRSRARQLENVTLEQKIATLKRDADYLRQRDAVKECIQDNKIECARLTRVIERVRGQMFPLERQRNNDAVEKLKTLGGPPPAAQLVRREARQIHRVTRLAARLKDVFLPFALREQFKLASGAVNDRATILMEFADIERSDPTIFKELLASAKRSAHRLHIRQSPYILLTPGCGILGFSWNPRGGAEVGRLVIPGYGPRPGLLRGLLTSLCADFRWDTSRESSGLDILTSDTLVARYATIRWEYRRCSVPVREKAGIYARESDRHNWRRHYALYLSSALEAGKKLYFKCPEIYEAVVKYVGLPDGVEKLSR